MLPNKSDSEKKELTYSPNVINFNLDKNLELPLNNPNDNKGLCNIQEQKAANQEFTPNTDQVEQIENKINIKNENQFFGSITEPDTTQYFEYNFFMDVITVDGLDSQADKKYEDENQTSKNFY